MSIWNEILNQARTGEVDSQLLRTIRESALTKTVDCPITFGTSGWRAEIGEDFTVYNVQKVTQAIVNTYKADIEELKNSLGVGSFTEFKKKGVLVGHDTRYCRKEFAMGVIAVLKEEGVRAAYAGAATTPEFSAGILMGNFACSINLTPSHNPGNYGGYKFNPADGGPAGQDITSTIEQQIIALTDFTLLPIEGLAWEEFNIVESYIQFVQSHNFIDLQNCREIAHSGKIALAVDSVYGATKGRMADILNNPESLTLMRTEDEPFFKGIAPEPSEKNMEELKKYLDTRPQALKLGAIMDPDGDRIMFYDGESFMRMNQFAVLAFYYLAVVKGEKGGVAKSVASSNFINIVMEKLGRPLYETAVGFKNFRPYLFPETDSPALICFEESDGISGFGNTLEKDAHMGFLIALELMGTTGKSLSQYLRDLQKEFGAFFPVRFGFEVDKAMIGAPMVKMMEALKNKFNSGMTVRVGDEDRIIKNVITVDGMKLVFQDESWLLIRPSGTEPKVRVYTESQLKEDAEALFETAKKLAFDQMKV